MIRQDTDIRYLKGIGEKRAELFNKLGVFNIGDLLRFLPRGYEDRTDIRDICDTEDGESVCIRGSLAGGIRSFRARTGSRVIQTRVSDGTGVMNLTWFNAPYVEKALRGEESFTFFGKVNKRGTMLEMINPIMEGESAAGQKMGKIVPIYPCTAGLTQQNIRGAVNAALDALEEPVSDIIPYSIRKKYMLLDADDAIRKIHQPQDFDSFDLARRSLAFEEFLILQAGVASAKQYNKEKIAPKISDVKCIAEFARKLPFELTNAQKRVINEISADIKREVPMNRLVQGDVGSGKTIVAAAVMYAVAMDGYSAVLMAPTEVLAKQHLKSLSSVFSKVGIKTAFLSGSQKAAERAENMALIESGEAKIIVGTHALITGKVKIPKLALAITDEQHRFGVKQRTALSGESCVHSLVMTATPIPRTLSLILYGDLDISVIDELPPGRKPVSTIAVSESQRKKVEAFVQKKLDEGRQAYFICPLVEESEVIDANAVEEYLKELKEGAYKNRKIQALHGRMKASEKDVIMQSFAEGKTEAIVATTVVEVGVDVPNATVMIIENAERFGLSQLHQLRGRVGRGENQSYCIMIYKSSGETAKERMKIMCETNDGFKISEKDLEIRGPGEFLGTRQHGLPAMRVGNLMSDMQILRDAHDAAFEILENDPTLSMTENQELKNNINKNIEQLGGVLN
ncbi:MAG: ATP-dependent DNA helicase RecG [Clostridia bacterium]|nr:ATP-dependent DNA helicase RecG [Clostridia bacterium]